MADLRDKIARAIAETFNPCNWEDMSPFEQGNHLAEADNVIEALGLEDVYAPAITHSDGSTRYERTAASPTPELAAEKAYEDEFIAVQYRTPWQRAEETTGEDHG